MKSLALKFLIYGTLAEIFARETGFNKGLGGSMHAFFTPFGIYPNNAIVGGSGDIAVGAALYKKVNRKPGIVVANIGDASLGCGPVWEGMTFAAMDQYRELWEGDMKGGLPIIFNIMNNQYGMGGQTCGETMGYTIAARVGAALNREKMHAERVDGYNPLAVIDAYERKMTDPGRKEGTRIPGCTHLPFQRPFSIRFLLLSFQGRGRSMGIGGFHCFFWQGTDGSRCGRSGGSWIRSRRRCDELILGAFKLSIDDQVSPRMDLVTHPGLIGEMMFSNESVDRMEEGAPEVNHPLEENPRVKQIARKERYAYDKDGKAHSAMKQYQFRDGHL